MLHHVPHTRDRILIQRIGVFAYHGVYEEEARLGQRFFITVDCGLDLSGAGQADDLTQSISYADIAAQVQEIAVGKRFKIIEALAEAIAQDLLTRFPRLEDVAVTIEKPAAAVPALLDTIAVTIRRQRGGLT